MLNQNAHHTLMAWLSPNFPIGGFAYSHGIEYAVHCGDVKTVDDFQNWLENIIEHGSIWNDALFIIHAYRADGEVALNELADLASALCASRERFLETHALGKAFAKAVNDIYGLNLAKNLPFPIVMGAALRRKNITVEYALPLILHSVAANLIAIGVRYIPLGQSDGQRILRALFPLMESVAQTALTSNLDDLGGMTFRADMASMHHETMTTRIFKT